MPLNLLYIVSLPECIIRSIVQLEMFVVITFGGMGRNCLFKGLTDKFDGMRLFDEF